MKELESVLGFRVREDNMQQTNLRGGNAKQKQLEKQQQKSGHASTSPLSCVLLVCSSCLFVFHQVGLLCSQVLNHMLRRVNHALYKSGCLKLLHSSWSGLGGAVDPYTYMHMHTA